MAVREKSPLQTLFEGLLVNNMAGEIEADEFLALVVDILDSYGNVATIPDGTFGVMSTTPGVLSPSALKQQTSNLLSTMAFTGPGQRVLDIGPISAVSEGSTVSFWDRSRDKMFGAVVHETTLGSGLERRPFYFVPGDDLVVTASAVDTSETFTGVTLQAAAPNAALGTAIQYQDLTRPAGSGEITGCNITIRRNSHGDEVPVFDYIRDVTGGLGFTLPAGPSTTTIDLGREYLFLAGETLYTTITGDGVTPLNLQGQTLGGQTIPHFDVQGRAGSIVTLANTTDLPTTESIQDIVGGMVSSNTETNITVTYDDTNGKLNFVVPTTPSGGFMAPSISSFSIRGVGTSVTPGTTMAGSQTFDFVIDMPGNVDGTLTLTEDGANLATDIDPNTTSTVQTINEVDYQAGDSTTFILSGVDTEGTPFSRSYIIAAPAAHEQAYVWVAETANYAAQDLAAVGVQSFDVSQAGAEFTFTVTVPNGSRVNILYPTDREITSIIEPPLNVQSLDEFVETNSVRTIAATIYDGRTDLNASGVEVAVTAIVTVGG